MTGLLGKIMRPTLDAAHARTMSGKDAVRGEVDGYRTSGPLADEFKFAHLKYISSVLVTASVTWGLPE